VNNSKLIKRIQRFNKGRDPELLQLKYKKMSESAFAFFRGSCHLFYEDWPNDSPLNKAPHSWICGDLHLENFGSYQGDNHLSYFDINDFDESALAPCTFDIVRLLTSIFLAFSKPHPKVSGEPESLCNDFLNAYISALVDGKARWVERETAKGLVKSLLDKQEHLQRKKFLDERTVIEGEQRKILIKEGKTRPVSDEQRKKVKISLEKFASEQRHPNFFKFIDVAWRIVGTGSLGLERFVALVEGKGSPDDNYLLDLKLEQESCLHVLDFPQPRWRTQAERIVAVQKRMQAISPALLNVLMIDDSAFVMREYQPTEARVNLDTKPKDMTELAQFMKTLGQAVAWSQLRSSGRQRSAIADELISFAQHSKWRKEAIKYSQKYSQQVEEDWQNFVQHWQQGRLGNADARRYTQMEDLGSKED